MICDFAEIYQITNIKALPVSTLAVLSCGLPAFSRTMRRESGSALTLEQTLLAAIADRLSVLCWQNTADAQKGRNKPKSILSELTKTDADRPMAFESVAAFEAAVKRLRGGE